MQKRKYKLLIMNIGSGTNGITNNPLQSCVCKGFCFRDSPVFTCDKKQKPPCNHSSHGGFDLLEADLIQPQTC